MAETKFTKGPWKATYWDGLVRGHESGVETSGRQASVHKADDLSLMIAPLGPVEDEESRANAHLIAAAPELYEKLEQITDCYGVGWKTPEAFVTAVHDFMMEARTLLSKARGEAQ